MLLCSIHTGLWYRQSRSAGSAKNAVMQEFSKSETVGLPSDEACNAVPLYLLTFIRFLDAYGIVIMSFDRIDARQLSQDNLILQSDITSDYTNT